MGEARVRAKAGQIRGAEARPAKWRTLADRLFAIDLRSLGMLRIFLGILVLADLFGRSTDLAAHYTDLGILPRAAVFAREPDNWSPHLSLHMMTGSTAGEAVLFALAAVWGIALLVGYRTTIATIITWYLLSSLQWRNTLIQNSADDLLRMLLFWGMFLPLGARFSLDARAKAKRKAASGAPVATKPRFLSVAAAAMLLQVGFLYWFAAASKTDPSWRVNGMAVYYTLSIDLYATPVGQFLLNFPQLLQVMTRMTLWLEALGPTLAFSPVATSPLRTILVVMFLAFHLVFLNACLDLAPFTMSPRSPGFRSSRRNSGTVSTSGSHDDEAMRLRHSAARLGTVGAPCRSGVGQSGSTRRFRCRESTFPDSFDSPECTGRADADIRLLLEFPGY